MANTAEKWMNKATSLLATFNLYKNTAVQVVHLVDKDGNSINNLIPTPTVDGQELVTYNGQYILENKPYTVDTGTNIARFKDDVYITGELFTQSNSVYIGGGLKVGASNETMLLNTFDNNNQYVFCVAEQGTGVTRIPRYKNRYQYWDKNSPTGQFQPSQTTVLNSQINPNYDPLNPRDPQKGYEHTFAIVVQAQGDLQVLNWYLRSATGFDNYYVKMYKGFQPLGTTAYPLWQSHNDDRIFKGQCFSHAPSVNADIEFNLGNTYYQNNGQLYTFIGFAESAFQFEAGTLNIPPFPPIDYPYVIADGYYVYDTPIFKPLLRIGVTENIEGSNNMNNGVVQCITKTLEQGDYNYASTILFSNGMDNVNQQCTIRYGIYNFATGALLTQGSKVINNTIPDKSNIIIPFDTVVKIEHPTAVRCCIVVNNYTSGGIVTLARTTAVNVNEAQLIGQAQLNSGAFPSTFNLTLSNSNTSINSVVGFDEEYIIPNQQSFLTVWQ